MIKIACNVVAPPRRKRNRRTTSTEHGERQYKEYRETGTVESAGDQVRVIPKDAWAVVSEVELDVEASNNLAEDDARLGRVVRDIAGVLDQLGHVDLGQREAANLGDKLKSTRGQQG